VIYSMSRRGRGGRSKIFSADRSLDPHPHSASFPSKIGRFFPGSAFFGVPRWSVPHFP
jgi:hypothetical protein